MGKDLLKKTSSITLSILEYLATATEGVAMAILDPKEARRMIDFDDYESKKLFDYLRGLKRSGYIQFEKDESKYSVAITNKGRIKLLENASAEIDSKWRMLSFDIPENRRADRDAFRATIKRIGFKQVQKSLWACPYVKADEVEIAIAEFDLNEYVAYMVVEKTDIEDYLKNLFSLD